MAELLLQYGADINWVINKVQGYTLLTQLCSVRMELSDQEQKLNLEIIKFLLEHGADRQLKSVDNQLPSILPSNTNVEIDFWRC